MSKDRNSDPGTTERKGRFTGAPDLLVPLFSRFEGRGNRLGAKCSVMKIQKQRGATDICSALVDNPDQHRDVCCPRSAGGRDNYVVPLWGNA